MHAAEPGMRGNGRDALFLCDQPRADIPVDAERAGARVWSLSRPKGVFRKEKKAAGMKGHLAAKAREGRIGPIAERFKRVYAGQLLAAQALAQFGQRGQHLVLFKGLDDIAAHPQPDRLLCRVKIAVGADEYDLGLLPGGVQRFDQFKPAHFRHPDVGHDHVRPFRTNKAKGFARGGKPSDDRKTGFFPGNEAAEPLKRELLVVYEHHSDHGACRLLSDVTGNAKVDASIVPR